MDIKVAGLIIGFVIVIGGVFMMSMTEDVTEGEPEENQLMDNDEGSEEEQSERPYFWEGTLIVVIGLAVIALSFLKEES